MYLLYSELSPQKHKRAPKYNFISVVSLINSQKYINQTFNYIHDLTIGMILYIHEWDILNVFLMITIQAIFAC